MIAFTGIWQLDQKPVLDEDLSPCLFQSPHWQLDHQSVWISGSFGLACTQRFITPECAHGLMPVKHKASGCIIAGDVYLTNRPALIDALNCHRELSDIELILEAWLKWGEDCTMHLSGSFMFAVLHPDRMRVSIVTDPFGHFPCLYAFQPGRHFIFSNTLPAFRRLCPVLTPDTELPFYFSLDSLPDENTCYREVKKMRAGSIMTVTAQGLSVKRYWKIEDRKKRLPCRTRADYYRAFRELFEKTVSSYVRSEYPIVSHISGGLDSSSVAAMAARLLQKRNRVLHGFTAMPQNPERSSFRENMSSNDLPLVEALLEQYPNIRHHLYQTDENADPFELVENFYDYVDQPFRNVFHIQWDKASFELAMAVQSRVTLTGSAGNLTISFRGQSFKDTCYRLLRTGQLWMRPSLSAGLMHDYFRDHRPEWIAQPEAKRILRRRGVAWNSHRWFTETGAAYSARRSRQRPLSLWYGIEYLDPTHDQAIFEFCYNVPQWVYCRGNSSEERRLLVREGLEGIVPKAILCNPKRGEQRADWHLQFNRHYSKWRTRLEAVPEQDFLWRAYDRSKILALFGPVPKPDYEALLQIRTKLAHCLSLAFFMQWQNGQRPVEQTAGALE